MRDQISLPGIVAASGRLLPVAFLSPDGRLLAVSSYSQFQESMFR
jgi:hypothetical protein